MDRLEKKANKLFDKKDRVKTLMLTVNDYLLEFLQLAFTGNRAYTTLEKWMGRKRRYLDFLQHRYKVEDKQETGMTIFQFIKTSRMQKALELMEDPSMNISEIVYHIGYESTSTFSNLFKQLVGISPQKYRRRFLLDEIS